MKVLTILFCPKEKKKKSKRWARAGRGCSTKRCLSLPWVSLRAASHQRACWVTRGWQCSLCLQSSRTPLLGEGGHITETKPPSAGPSARPKKKHLFPLFYQIRVPSLIGEVSNQKWGIKQFNHLSLNSKACRCPHVIKKKKKIWILWIQPQWQTAAGTDGSRQTVFPLSPRWRSLSPVSTHSTSV